MFHVEHDTSVDPEISRAYRTLMPEIKPEKPYTYLHILGSTCSRTFIIVYLATLSVNRIADTKKEVK